MQLCQYLCFPEMTIVVGFISLVRTRKQNITLSDIIFQIESKRKAFQQRQNLPTMIRFSSIVMN